MKRFFLLFMMGGLSILLLVGDTRITSAALSFANESSHSQRDSTRVEDVPIQGTGQLTAKQKEERSVDKIYVVTKVFEPLVIKNERGFTGFSIDLWIHIANRLDLTYEFIEVKTVTEQLAYVQRGDADVAIAGISITQARERRLDFTHPYFTGGLLIAAPVEQISLVRGIFSAIFSCNFLELIGAFILTVLVAGHIIWLCERHVNPGFPRGYFSGLWASIWWASVTVTTVGYGDKIPLGRSGRAFALVWMFVGLFLIANFTAGLTTLLAVRELRGTVTGLSDLADKRVATIVGSTSSQYLIEHGIRMIEVTTVDEAAETVVEGKAQAIIYDAPVLLYYVQTQQQDVFQIIGGIFNPESYGIAVPTGSHYREMINRVLLEIQEDGTYDTLYAKWFGSS
ncbi:transporter substrate-binding domain-containing protein [Chloroflexi bacterium TSY]|nr:transporter substrate-binding domain-containing protein [Chloroflexi bacterium TSY]